MNKYVVESFAVFIPVVLQKLVTTRFFFLVFGIAILHILFAG